MATFYNNLKVGASNNADEVRRLQNALISAGYNVGSTGADGIYGKNTAAAVRAYQQANGLTVDGIAGAKTQGALYGSAAVQTPFAGNNTAAWLSSGSASISGGTGAYPYAAYSPYSSYSPTVESSVPSSYPSYAESEDLIALRKRLEDYESSKPGEYESAYSDQINDLMDKISNREAFSYNYNEDPLYDQYRQAYTAQGRLAMQDSMGNAAALTGGYGSSYGQQVGQQTYQAYMQELNNKIPELAQDSFAHYQAEGQDMYNRLGMYQNQDASDYEKYLGRLQDYYNELDYLTGRYDTQYSQDYNEYLNRLAAYQDQRDFDYQKQIDQRNFAYQQQMDQRDFAYQQQRDAQAQANWQAEYNLSAQKSRSNGSSGGSSSGSRATSGSSAASYYFPDLTLSQAKQAVSVISREEGINTARQEALNLIASGKIIGVTKDDVNRAMSYLIN